MSFSSLFPDLPDDARIWVYTTADPLSDEERRELEERLTSFVDGWTSHQQPVRGAVAIRDDRFVMLAATVEGGDVSGCGIDASVHAVDDAAGDLAIDWLGPLDIIYRDDDGTVQTASRPQFRSLVAEGDVDGDTHVFDPSVTTLGEVRSGGFELPAADAWHGRLFQIPTTA
jgi:hypothetical protein